MDKKFLRRVIWFLIKMSVLTLFTYTNLYSQEGWDSSLQKCWQKETLQMTTIPLASDNNRSIYVPILGGILRKVDADSGKIIWSTELGGEFIGDIHSESRGISIIVNNGQGSILKHISSDDGIINSSFNVGFNESSYLIKENKTSFLLSKSGTVISFSDENKKEFDMNNSLFSVTNKPIKRKDELVFGTSNKTLLLYSLKKYSINQQINLEQNPTGNIIFSDRRFYLGDQLGNIYSIHEDTKKIVWKRKIGAEVLGIKKVKGNLLIYSKDNYLYFVSQKSGHIHWKKKFSGRFVGVTLLDLKTAVVLATGTNIAFIINITDGRVINSLNFPLDSYFVSPAVYVGNNIVIPYQDGLVAYSKQCQIRK